MLRVLLPKREVVDLLGPAFDALISEGFLPAWVSPAGEPHFAVRDVEVALGLLADDRHRAAKRARRARARRP